MLQTRPCLDVGHGYSYTSMVGTSEYIMNRVRIPLILGSKHDEEELFLIWEGTSPHLIGTFPHLIGTFPQNGGPNKTFELQ